MQAKKLWGSPVIQRKNIFFETIASERGLKKSLNNFHMRVRVRVRVRVGVPHKQSNPPQKQVPHIPATPTTPTRTKSKNLCTWGRFFEVGQAQKSQHPSLRFCSSGYGGTPTGVGLDESPRLSEKSCTYKFRVYRAATFDEPVSRMTRRHLKRPMIA